MKRPSSTAFELAVVGVIAPLGTGIVEACRRCVKANASHEPCAGFGEGCFVRNQPPRHPPGGGRSRSE